MVILVEFKNALFCVLPHYILIALGIANLQNYTEQVIVKASQSWIMCIFFVFYKFAMHLK